MMRGIVFLFLLHSYECHSAKPRRKQRSPFFCLLDYYFLVSLRAGRSSLSTFVTRIIMRDR